MAKDKTVKSDGIDKALLKLIVDATAAGTLVYVGPVAGQPMVAHVPQLIEVNAAITNPADPTQVACRSLPAAADYLAAQVAVTGSTEAPKSNYAIMTGITLPEAKKRGNTSGSGAPTKYPFADMEVGAVFFSGNSEHAKGDAVKALGSTVSAQNDKYSEPKMENGTVVTKQVTRAVRDPKTHKAVLGPDGKKQTETVTLPVKDYKRKFTIRGVAKGYQSGSWTAPEDGALIGRVV